MNVSMPRRRLIGRDVITDDGTPMMSAVLRREARSVPIARQFARDVLLRWQLAELADEAQLVITELTANTINHARADHIRVTVRRLDEGRVRVAVIDRSRAVPVLRKVDDDTEHGRGLALVEAVSVEWGVDAFQRGKRVWADLETSARDAAEGHPHRYDSAQAQALYGFILLALGAVITVCTLTR
ncbi:ATP-binding protein [Streptomyces broussonetiae]|uniref:ATP-binding protein n=1 Tax=Streptomyces broussonetiae TaxID=2686304 RepID=A0ABV5EK21_9ACTN